MTDINHQPAHKPTPGTNTYTAVGCGYSVRRYADNYFVCDVRTGRKAATNAYMSLEVASFTAWYLWVRTVDSLPTRPYKAVKVAKCLQVGKKPTMWARCTRVVRTLTL